MGFPAPPPGFPMPPMPFGAPGTPSSAQRTPVPAAPMAAAATAVEPTGRETVPSSSRELKAGTLLVYGDEETSPVRRGGNPLPLTIPASGALTQFLSVPIPGMCRLQEEKRARLRQYRVEDEPELAAAPATAGGASATGPAEPEAVGNVASAAVEGAPGSVAVGDAGGSKAMELYAGGGDPLTAEVETGGAGAAAGSAGAAAATGGRGRATAAELMEE